MSDDLRYFYGEVAEEGSLFIAFGYLHREHGWTLERFQEEVARAVQDGAGSLAFDPYKGESRRIGLEEIDFSSQEGFRFVEFCPTEIAWDFYNRYVGDPPAV